MVNSQSISVMSYAAGSPVQAMRILVLDSNTRVVQASDATHQPIGLCAMSVPQADFDARLDVTAGGNVQRYPACAVIRPNGCFAKVEAGDVIAIGDLLMSDSSGRAVPASGVSGTFTIGYARSAAAAAGEIVQVHFIVDRDQA